MWWCSSSRLYAIVAEDAGFLATARSSSRPGSCLNCSVAVVIVWMMAAAFVRLIWCDFPADQRRDTCTVRSHDDDDDDDVIYTPVNSEKERPPSSACTRPRELFISALAVAIIGPRTDSHCTPFFPCGCHTSVSYRPALSSRPQLSPDRHAAYIDDSYHIY